MRERSSKSFTSRSIPRPAVLMASACCTAGPGGSVSRSCSLIPSIAFSGVRTSWLIAARKSLLSCAICSARDYSALSFNSLR